MTAYETVPFRLEQHRDALAALWRANMSDEAAAAAAPERMRWLYERSADEATRTWVAVARSSGEVVGCGSVVPRTLVVDGRAVRGGLLADFAVSRAHRSAAAAIAIQRAVRAGSVAEGIEVLYGYPNARSRAVFERVGYRPVAWTTRWVRPLRSASVVRTRVHGERLARATSRVVDAGLGLVDDALASTLRTRRRVRGRRPLGFFELTRADGRFDDLWQRVRTQHRACGARSAAYLNWRYGELATRDHRFFGAQAGGGLAGYVVYRTNGETASIEDLLVDDVEGALEPLLVALVRRLRARGLASLSCTYAGPDRFARHLRAVGFFPRPERRVLLAHVDDRAPAATRSVVLDGDAWLMMDGELDL